VCEKVYLHAKNEAQKFNAHGLIQPPKKSVCCAKKVVAYTTCRGETTTRCMHEDRTKENIVYTHIKASYKEKLQTKKCIEPKISS
jgi:hypothetical protein